MSLKDEIRGNLAKYMNLAGVTKSGLAHAVGINPSAVGRWLSGDSSIDIDNVPAVCKCLGITMAALLGEDDGARVPGRAEREMLEKFGSLDVQGKAKAIGYVDDLIASGRYAGRDAG